MSWSFQRIPPEQHGRILEAYSQGDYITITAIYNQHNVMPSTMCEACALKLIIEYTEYAIKKGFFNGDKERKMDG